MITLKEFLQILADLPPELMPKAEEAYQQQLEFDKKAYERQLEAQASGEDCGLDHYDYRAFVKQGIDFNSSINCPYGHFGAFPISGLVALTKLYYYHKNQSVQDGLAELFG